MDPNKLMDSARRERARRSEEGRDHDRRARDSRQRGAEGPSPVGSGLLRMERRQGQWRYYLEEQRVRVGDDLQLFLNEAVGWIDGTFQWGRRNVSPATLRIRVTHPVSGAFVGEAEVHLPDDAVLRWPLDSTRA